MGIGSVIFMAAFVLLLTLAVGAASSAPWVPTKKRDRETVIAALAEDGKMLPGAVVYDLGCGDGAMLFALADAFPGIRARGYEIALPPLAAGWVRRALGGEKYREVRMYWRDFFGKDVADADVVFVFSMPHMHAKMHAFLAKSLRDDATVVIEAWMLPGVPHERKVGGVGHALPFYIYRGKAIRDALVKQKIPA
jgi:SAM-dependent methyltransferase